MKAIARRKRFSNVVCATIVVLLTLLAFISPTMAISIDNFVITPTSNTVGATSEYTIQINTTNFTSLNITISKGFGVETPQAGDLIAEVDLWWDNPTPYYGYVSFTANATSPETKMDVYADIGGGTATLLGMSTNHNEGATTSIKSPFGSHEERANLTLPTASANGCLKMFSLPNNITNITVSVGNFVLNPTTAGDYVFTAEGVNETVHIVATSTQYETISFDLAETNIAMMIMGLALIPIITILTILIAAIYRREEPDWRTILVLFAAIGISCVLLLVFFVMVVVIQTV